MRAGRHLILALFLSVPALGRAEPAVVRVFEAQVRSGPDRSAPVVHVFAENAQLSVSEEATQGWRKVRLPDGGVGFVEETVLAFPGRAASAPAPGAAAASAAPASEAPVPRIYVKDLDHFAELVKDDPKVAPMARSLVKRRTAAFVVLGVGLAASAGLVIAGISHFDDPESDKTGAWLFSAGLVGGGISIVASGLIHPGHGDFLDSVNEWNARHPDRQFELTPAGSPHQAALPPGPARGIQPGFTPVAGLALTW